MIKKKENILEEKIMILPRNQKLEDLWWDTRAIFNEKLIWKDKFLLQMKMPVRKRVLKLYEETRFLLQDSILNGPHFKPEIDFEEENIILEFEEEIKKLEINDEFA